MKKLVSYISIGLLALMMVGCKIQPNYIIISSATTVGFDVSESTVSQTPQATLAYKRGELVIVPVPTNGPVPDVIMDFNFKTSIFSSDGGIYSRVATGPNATTASPAMLMMAKDQKGNILTNLPTILPSILPLLTPKPTK